MRQLLAMLAWGLCLGACACVRGIPPERALLDEAIASAGGRAALAARTLRWTGTATVHAGSRTVDIGVETEVVTEPLRAVSITWVLSEGRKSERILKVDTDSGSGLRDGREHPLPTQVAEHERRQYELYGLMRLLPLEAPGMVLHRLPDSDGLRGLQVTRPERPDVALWFGLDGTLRRLDTLIHDPENNEDKRQRIEFDGQIVGDGVRWPRHMRIYWNDAPFFEMTLQSFGTR